MARLWNNRTAPTQIYPTLSYGPFAGLGEGQVIFHPSVQSYPSWLGFNASALFGIPHCLETWTFEDSEEFDNVRRAYEWAKLRSERSLAGKLKLRSAETISRGALVHQYVCVSVLDQFATVHQRVAESMEEHAKQLLKDCESLFKDSFIDAPNFLFGFTFKDAKDTKRILTHAPTAGILIRKPDNLENEFVFQLNLSFRPEYMTLFFQRLQRLLEFNDGTKLEFDSPEITLPTHLKEQFKFHTAVIGAKSTGKLETDYRAVSFLQRQLQSLKLDASVKVIDASNYQNYREQILAMQTATYEPARRSPPEEFDMLFASEKPLAILVLHENEIIAMTFAGRLGLFTQERGVAQDPWVDDPSTYYSMDLTVAPEFHGGLGRTMKQAQLLLAIENGVTAIHGRNRDRLAGGMWAINLSLGSYELQNLQDDYPDEGEFRDCIYYRCPLKWERNFDEYEASRIRNSVYGMVSGSLLNERVIEQ